MSDSQCPHCHAHRSEHSLFCPLAPPEWKAANYDRLAENFHSLVKRRDEERKQRRGLVTALQGKCAMLRHENNKLRSRESQRRAAALALLAAWCEKQVPAVAQQIREWAEGEYPWLKEDRHDP